MPSHLLKDIGFNMFHNETLVVQVASYLAWLAVFVIYIFYYDYSYKNTQNSK